MNKMNKKGFTLIEMLVVIAIIAILVSIIIPAVSSSTKRAAAATDAANLRSAKAVISIGLLDGTYEKNTPKGVITADKCGVPNESKYDESKTFSAAIDGEGNVYVAYGELTIEDLADLADDGQDNGTVSGGTLAPDDIGGDNDDDDDDDNDDEGNEDETVYHDCGNWTRTADTHTCGNQEGVCSSNHTAESHTGMTEDNKCDICEYTAEVVVNHTCGNWNKKSSGHKCQVTEGTCPDSHARQEHSYSNGTCTVCDYSHTNHYDGDKNGACDTCGKQGEIVTCSCGGYNNWRGDAKCDSNYCGHDQSTHNGTNGHCTVYWYTQF